MPQIVKNPNFVPISFHRKIKPHKYAVILYSKRATGIEPAYSAWEADILPLNYARMQNIIVQWALDNNQVIINI